MNVGLPGLCFCILHSTSQLPCLHQHLEDLGSNVHTTLCQLLDDLHWDPLLPPCLFRRYLLPFLHHLEPLVQGEDELPAALFLPWLETDGDTDLEIARRLRVCGPAVACGIQVLEENL